MDPQDAQFGQWAQEYIGPISDIFAGLRADPPKSYPEVRAEYAVAYQRLYDSLAAGDAGDPSLAAALVDPATVSSPMELPNAVAAITDEMAVRERAEAVAALDAMHGAQHQLATTAPILFAGGGVLVVVLLITTLGFAKREAHIQAEIEQLQRLTTTDPLTNLGNRRGFEEAVEHLSAASSRSQVSLVMMDLDGFKAVNDTFGHDRGDGVLRLFATLVDRIAPPGAGRFRIGGDEFALLLHGINGPDAEKLAEELRAATSDLAGGGVTLSAGVAVWNPESPDEALLRQQADAALYQAKLRGRDGVVRYRADCHAAPVFPAAKLQAVRELLVEGRIEAVFQPIWDAHARNLLGFEGLSRPHPDYDLSGPQQAFEIAERFGRAAELDALCRHHILAASGHLPPDGRLFINLSPYSLTHQSFSAEALLDEIDAAGIDPSRVVFEITERSQVAPDLIAETVANLRRHGLAVALDDVGSGNNGLEMLSKVPFDYVKVDRQVVLAATTGSSGRAALMAILAFASESDAIVIAEGIEDNEMFEVVREFARASVRGNPGLIHCVQGFLFGYPVPANLAATQPPSSLAA